MTNKRVLLVGTSFSAVSLLQYLKNLGYTVAVCGGYENDPCHMYADESFDIDYSKQVELLKLCIKENFDCIIPSCNDYAYNSSSYVATKLNQFYGFDNIKITNILHSKSKFREFSLKNNLSVPKAIKYSKNLNLDTLNLAYPILVKPDDGFSGKGVIKVNNSSNLKKAIKIAKENSRNSNVVIEEFVEGNLYSHSAFIQDGQIAIDFFVDEFCSVYPYQVDSSCISQNLSKNLKINIRKDIQKLVKLLNITDGLLHTQIITDGTQFWLIETMRRCPGDLYGTLIQKATGFDYAKFYIKPFLNQKNNIDGVRLDNKFVARHTISIPKALIFKSLKHTLRADKLDFYPLKESGSVLKEAPCDKVGLVFYEFSTQSELIKNTKNMKDFFILDSYEGITNE